MSPMAFTALLLLLLLGAGTCVAFIPETSTETTTTDTTTTETTTTESTTTETTTETTISTVTTAPNITISRNTSGNLTRTPTFPYATVFPATSNTTNFRPNNSSAGNAAVNTTTVPISSSTAMSHANATTNSSNWVSTISSNTTNSTSVVPSVVPSMVPSVAPTSPPGGGMATPFSSTTSNTSSSTLLIPMSKTSASAQGSTAPRQTPLTTPGSGHAPNPSEATAPLPTGVRLLRRIPLSFHILNRSFNESLRDPTSKDYRILSHAVLTMFEYVFGCTSCESRRSYKGCSELWFSPGSVAVESILVFGPGDETVSSVAAEQQLRDSLDQNGFVMDLQLASIRSAAEVTSPAPVPVVPDWAIALLVLVCILLLLSILTCLLMTTCTCRRKSRGKLDLFSTKDSYQPMAEYPPYQSHGRYVSPSSKPNPYSQVASSNGAGTGTFTYTNPAAASDNL